MKDQLLAALKEAGYAANADSGFVYVPAVDGTATFLRNHYHDNGLDFREVVMVGGERNTPFTYQIPIKG